MRKVFLMLLLATLNSSAMAEWVNAGTGTDGTNVYANPSTIRKKGNKVKLWAMFDYKTPNTANTYPPSTYQSAKLQYEFDCEEEQYTTNAFYDYSENMGGGKVVFSSEMVVKMSVGVIHWVPVMPDTLDNVLLNYACKKKYRDAINAQAKQEIKKLHGTFSLEEFEAKYSSDKMIPEEAQAAPASGTTPNTKSLADEWDAIEVKQSNK